MLLSTGAEYRKLPVEGLADYEGISVFYAAGPPEAHLCGGQRVGVVGGGNSAAQAAIWLARGGALVTLLHRRADLSETMSNYLIKELDRYGVAVRDHSEIEVLHGTDGHLDGVTLTDGTEVPFSFLFLFLGAAPCTSWLGDCIARDEKGFVLTGTEAEADGLLETSIPGVYAPATSAPAQSSAARPRSARVQRWCGLCMSTSRSRAVAASAFDSALLATRWLEELSSAARPESFVGDELRRNYRWRRVLDLHLHHAQLVPRVGVERDRITDRSR